MAPGSEVASCPLWPDLEAVAVSLRSRTARDSAW
jgi:hypothetical protein